jgi:hypothetical protein
LNNPTLKISAPPALVAKTRPPSKLPNHHYQHKILFDEIKQYVRRSLVQLELLRAVIPIYASN